MNSDLLLECVLEVEGDLLLEADAATHLALPELGEQLRGERVVVRGAPVADQDALPLLARRILAPFSPAQERLPLTKLWRRKVAQV